MSFMKPGPSSTALTLFSFLLTLHCSPAFKIRPLRGAGGSPAAGILEADSGEYWDLIEETIASPLSPEREPVRSYGWFINRIEPRSFVYVYGGRTAGKVQPGTSKECSGVFACYLDNEDYSGVTIANGDGNSVNFTPLLKKRAAGIGFWARGGVGTESVYFGLLDDESDGRKVQTRVALRDFGKLDTAWNYFMIPVRRFGSKGKYWDAGRKSEVVADVEWNAINEVRFSVNKGENHVGRGEPVRLYVGHLTIIEEIPGYIDPDEYWAAFSSQEPDLRLHDFEMDWDGNRWTTGSGPGSRVALDIVSAKGPAECGTKALEVTYLLNDWCDVMCDYRTGGPYEGVRDWTAHWGLKLMVYTEKSYQPLNLQISDAGEELYIASCGAPSGWNEIIVPFRDFVKFPYYQPPGARHDGKFDLDAVVMLDIKPAGEGSEGTFRIDNIALTNDRAAKSAPVAAEREVTVRGDFGSVVTAGVNDGIFGINAQHWDGDLLLRETAERVGKVRHGVIRFPGGLSADEYHWESVLNAKDNNVDIDEFLAFCRKAGCEPMLTVNFGTGTAEEAARWVRYVNIVRKARVRYWEVGNELYGDWHKNHCEADAYGRRASEFIRAMKAADPEILVTVVWEIESPWNKIVFDRTREIADGVNIHNYPQESGEENDRALLAAPPALEGIIGRVRKQLAEYGVPGRPYQIWLTEWNSVDFNPGPQSLGMVNALFVADYLGMLAKLDIEQASYWNIHNSMFEQGGDYGYLSRSDVAEGPNVPRPSYWAFRLASGSLRGKLVECSSDDIDVPVYAAIGPDGGRRLMVINKHPATTARVRIDLPGFAGELMEYRLTGQSGTAGYTTRQVALGRGEPLEAPPYSIVVLHKR